MIERRVARRYALALIQTAADNAALEILRADVQTLAQAIHASHDLRVFLRSPIINMVKKKAALSTAFDSSVSPTMQLFIKLLCEKRRERVLPEIVEEFFLLYDKRMGIERPTVTTAVPLDAAQQQLLQKTLAARLKKIVEPVYVVDKKVLGGVKVKIDDTVIDGSVAYQLQTLREEMLAKTN